VTAVGRSGLQGAGLAAYFLGVTATPGRPITLEDWPATMLKNSCKPGLNPYEITSINPHMHLHARDE
jgi:hypothetical protein